MGDVINLRQARKAKARAAADAKAAANRHAFGRTKAEKHIARDEAARRDAVLDGARRERKDDTPDGDASDGCQ